MGATFFQLICIMANIDVTKKQGDNMGEDDKPRFQRPKAGALSLKRISWSAVFGGVVIAVVVQIALSLLGIGIGLGTIDVQSEANPANGLGIGSAIWYGVSSLASLFAGAFVAGRLSQSRNVFDGMIHGLLTWSLITLITLYFLTSVIGSIIGGVGNLVGSTLSAAGNLAGKGLQAAAPALSGELQEQGIDLETLKQEAKQLLRQTGKPALQPDSLSNQAAAVADNSENAASRVAANPQQADNQIDQLFDRIKDRGNGIVSQVDKQAMVNIIMARTGKPEDEANRIADNWIASYHETAAQWQTTKQQAVEKAEEIADKTASVASTAAIGSFIALLLGAIVSALGAKVGSESKDNERLQPAVV